MKIIDALKNKYALMVIAFSLATAAIYLLLPLFRIPLYGISTGIGYISLLWKVGDYSNMASFLLPLIGSAGAIVTVLFKDRGPHILSLAFTLLPAMFFAYFLIMLEAMMVNNPMGITEFSIFEIAGSGVWAGLAASLLAFASSILLVVKDFKGIPTLKIKSK